MDIGLPDRAGIQQRVLPEYRAAFFDSLARALPGGVSVLAGEPRTEEAISQAKELQVARRARAVNRYFGGGRWLAVWQSGWREWISVEDPPVAVLEANPRLLSNYFLQRWMRNRGRPVAGWSLGPFRGGIAGSLASAYYGGFSALIVYSCAASEAFRKLGIPQEKIFVAPNAVESRTAETLMGRPGAREEARKSLGPDSRPMILFVGRLQARKRVDLLLRACRRLEIPHMLMIVGDGPDRARLEKAAIDLGSDARFLGDLRGEPLGRCFLAADLFVMPGTGGLALQEAMLYGKPVAAAEADGSQRDLIREGENGWLLPPADEEALFQVLRRALQDKARLKSMGEASRRIVLATATLEKMTAGFLEAIKFCLRSGERRV
jgi:glycosyltransferase involved in cell wall biosynthesis